MPEQPKPNPMPGALLWIVLFLVLGLSFLSNLGRDSGKLDHTQLMEQVEQGNISSMLINKENGSITGVLKQAVGGTTSFQSEIPIYLIGNLMNDIKASKSKSAKVDFSRSSGFWSSILISWGPILFFLFFFMFIMPRIMGAQGGGSFFKNFMQRAKLAPPEKTKTTFKDVAGVDEATQELQEIVEFLKSPAKFQKLGGRIPRGVLLIGPPGTGKTLLARAVAGEASVPFFSISGSDFVEMFVGVGASRVRKLFGDAKQNAPCIIFIDEIDAVGRSRGMGLTGHHEEREQTLNQILSEMDGFELNDGVIIIAATNRPEILDPALLRPGRFDRHVVIDRPDVKGRTDILKIHSRKLPLAENVDLTIIAKGTPGFSGADLANLLNEAALLATRKNKSRIELSDLEDAKDKTLMGAERRSAVLSKKEKNITAVHEAGHTIVASKVPEADPIHKVTIIPRGRSLGSTWQLPEEDKHSYSKKYLISLIAILMGGRAAEELVFGEEQVTTGAKNDFERATDIAKRMVREWGMSDLGPMTFGSQAKNAFLEQFGESKADYSEDTARQVDDRVQKFVREAYNTARKILISEREQLDKLSAVLFNKEKLTGEEVRELLQN